MATNAEGSQNEAGRHQEVGHKSLLQSDAFYQYILEPEPEPEPMKELREITAKHPWNTGEIGVYTGYSLLATALPLPEDGKILAMDINRENYELGLPVIEKAGVAHKIDFREGPALSVLGLPMEDFKTSFRVLDMVLISGKDLKVKHFFKMDVFALASVQGYNNNLYNSLQKTPTDKDGGSNPIWNYRMKFLIDVVAAENSCLTLVINLKADGSFGHKDIGEVHVPVKELLDKYGPSNDEMLHASYNVRTTRAGKFKGVLNFSFKFGDTVAPAPWSSVAAPPTAGGYPYPLALGYGGYQLPQMQPPEETSMGKKIAKYLGALFCGFGKIAVTDAIFDDIEG